MICLNVYVTNNSCNRISSYSFKKFLNHRADSFECLFCPSLKSTKIKPNRTVYPADHSKLSSNDHGKYPFTLTPSLQTKERKIKYNDN